MELLEDRQLLSGVSVPTSAYLPRTTTASAVVESYNTAPSAQAGTAESAREYAPVSSYRENSTEYQTPARAPATQQTVAPQALALEAAALSVQAPTSVPARPVAVAPTATPVPQVSTSAPAAPVAPAGTGVNVETAPVARASPVLPADRAWLVLPALAGVEEAKVTKAYLEPWVVGLPGAGEGLAETRPELGSVLAGALPVDGAALQRHAEDFFRRLDDLGGDRGSESAVPTLLPWLVVGAMANVAFDVARWQLRQRGGPVWRPAPGPPGDPGPLS